MRTARTGHAQTLTIPQRCGRGADLADTQQPIFALFASARHHGEPGTAIPLGTTGVLMPAANLHGDQHRQPAVPGWVLESPAGSVTLQPAPAVPAGNPSAFYYDRAYSRWVPVGRGAVSPDGSHYAYMSYQDAHRGVMTIVDVATGDVRTYPATPAQPQLFYVVLDYAKEGIYLGLAFIEGPISGLWLMDLNTGAIRQLADLFDIRAIAGSVVWLGSLNPADPNPVGGLGVSPDSVDRFDLITGSRTPWLYLPEKGVGVVAVDLAGHPIVEVGDTSNDFQLLLLTGAGTAEQIFQGPSSKLQGLGAPLFFPAIADKYGVWFGSSTGIYLYSPAVGLRKVSDQAAYPGNGCT